MDKCVGYTVLRLAVGINLLVGGLVPILNGGDMGNVELYLATVVGGLLIVGLGTRWVLLGASAWVLAKVGWHSSQTEWSALAAPMVYAMAYFLLASHLPYNQWSIDGMMGNVPREEMGAAAAAVAATASVSSASAEGGAGDVVDGPGHTAVKGATKLLAMHIGPFARVVAGESMAKMAVKPERITQAQFGLLVNMMSEKLTDTSSKEKFVTEATALGDDLAA